MFLTILYSYWFLIMCLLSSGKLMKKKRFNKKALTPEQSFREKKKAKNKKQSKGYHLIKKYSNNLALYRVRTHNIY